MTFCREHLRSGSPLSRRAVSRPATPRSPLVSRCSDARDRDVSIENPSRIVSIGGAITEILYALGLEDRIAGVDTTSLFPAAALREKPNVGYMRQLSAEGVLGLNPSLVFAIEGVRVRRKSWKCWRRPKVPLVLVPETLYRAGLARQDQTCRPRHGCGCARGLPDGRRCRTTSTQMRQLRARVTKPVRVMFVMSLRERPRDGRRAKHRGRRNHQAIRRRQRYRQLMKATR